MRRQARGGASQCGGASRRSGASQCGGVPWGSGVPWGGDVLLGSDVSLGSGVSRGAEIMVFGALLRFASGYSRVRRGLFWVAGAFCAARVRGCRCGAVCKYANVGLKGDARSRAKSRTASTCMFAKSLTLSTRVFGKAVNICVFAGSKVPSRRLGILDRLKRRRPAGPSMMCFGEKS